MSKLTINGDCDKCGKCEVFLPGILDRIEAHGHININPRNPNVNTPAINRAIISCRVGALELVKS